MHAGIVVLFSGTRSEFVVVALKLHLFTISVAEVEALFCLSIDHHQSPCLAFSLPKTVHYQTTSLMALGVTILCLQ